MSCQQCYEAECSGAELSFETIDKDLMLTEVHTNTV